MQRPSLRLRLHVLLLVGVSLVASGLPAADPAVAAPTRPTSPTDTARLPDSVVPASPDVTAIGDGV
jgi:hypothetical protein